METIIELLKIFISWPVAAVLLVFMLKDYIDKLFQRFIDSKTGEAEIGPVKVKLGELVTEGREVIDHLSELHILIAKSRLIELRFARRNMAHGFEGNEIKELEELINQLDRLLSANKAAPADAPKARAAEQQR